MHNRFPIKTQSFSEHNTIFGNFCDKNVCACTLGALILLPVTNLSPETDSVSLISYKMETFRI